MSPWKWLLAIAIAIGAGGPQLLGQSIRDERPRADLPFTVQPDRLGGAPRAEGELPVGIPDPPSSQPGRIAEPPIADGFSPEPLYGRPAPRLADPLTTGPGGDLLRRRAPLETGTRVISPLEPLPGQPGGIRGEEEQEKEKAEALALPDPLVPESESESELTMSDSPLLPRTPRRGERTGASLRLGELLGVVERSYPPLLTVIEERNLAAAGLLEAVGGFDLGLNVDSRNWGLGYYKRNLFDIFVEQPTALWGTKFFAGYRLGRGDWPIYYQYLQTQGGGAYVTGLELPILRGGRIDVRRALLWQAEIDRRRVEPEVSKKRIEVFNVATIAYWNWLGAGLSHGVYEKLLNLAVDRNEGIRSQVQRGALAPIELVDNERVILQRQTLLVSAKRRYQRAAIDLSLYLRDTYCMPVIADPERLPEVFPPSEEPRPERLPQDIEVAFRLRPELAKLRLDAQRAGIDRELARNLLLPGVNFYVYGEQNVGSPVPLRNKHPYILETSILVDVPLQRRQARGKVQAADTRLRQIQLQTRYAADEIVADVKDAMSSLLAGYEILEQARQSVVLNRKLEEAEIKRFRQGASTILFVNLREQTTADSENLAIDAEIKFYEALANYRAALGIDACPGTAP